jgi:hypothetical protein
MALGLLAGGLTVALGKRVQDARAALMFAQAECVDLCRCQPRLVSRVVYVSCTCSVWSCNHNAGCTRWPLRALALPSLLLDQQHSRNLKTTPSCGNDESNGCWVASNGPPDASVELSNLTWP